MSRYPITLATHRSEHAADCDGRFEPSVHYTCTCEAETESEAEREPIERTGPYDECGERTLTLRDLKAAEDY